MVGDVRKLVSIIIGPTGFSKFVINISGLVGVQSSYLLEIDFILTCHVDSILLEIMGIVRLYI